MEPGTSARTKDLPVISNPLEVNPQDRLFSVYLIANSNYKATYGITVASLTRGVLLAMLEDGTVNSRYNGLTEPFSDLGENGDLYFQYSIEQDAIIGFFIKYEDEWLSF